VLASGSALLTKELAAGAHGPPACHAVITDFFSELLHAREQISRSVVSEHHLSPGHHKAATFNPCPVSQHILSYHSFPPARVVKHVISKLFFLNMLQIVIPL
jgi:hypothetical protein